MWSSIFLVKCGLFSDCFRIIALKDYSKLLVSPNVPLPIPLLIILWNMKWEQLHCKRERNPVVIIISVIRQLLKFWLINFPSGLRFQFWIIQIHIHFISCLRIHKEVSNIFNTSLQTTHFFFIKLCRPLNFVSKPGFCTHFPIPKVFSRVHYQKILQPHNLSLVCL